MIVFAYPAKTRAGHGHSVEIKHGKDEGGKPALIGIEAGTGSELLS